MVDSKSTRWILVFRDNGSRKISSTHIASCWRTDSDIRASDLKTNANKRALMDRGNGKDGSVQAKHDTNPND